MDADRSGFRRGFWVERGARVVAFGAFMNILSNAPTGPADSTFLEKAVPLPELEADHWKHCYRSRPYVEDNDTYDDFGPAYAFGLQLFRTRTERVPSDLECHLADDWNASRGKSSLRWDRAKHAAYDAWERLAHLFEH